MRRLLLQPHGSMIFLTIYYTRMDIITCSVIRNTCGPMYNSPSKVPIICLGEPSYALAIMVLGLI